MRAKIYANYLKVLALIAIALVLFLGCVGGGTSGTSGTHSRALFSLITQGDSNMANPNEALLETENGEIVGSVPLAGSGKIEFTTKPGNVTLSLQTTTNQHAIVLNNLESQGSILLLRGSIASSSEEFQGDSYEFALRTEQNCRKFFTENGSLYLSDAQGVPNSCLFEVVVKKNGASLPRAIVHFYQGDCGLPSAYNSTNKVDELVTNERGVAGIIAELDTLRNGNCYTFQALVNESGREDLVVQVVP